MRGERESSIRREAFIEGMGGLLKRGRHPLEFSGKNHRLYSEFDGVELKGRAEWHLLMSEKQEV